MVEAMVRLRQRRWSVWTQFTMRKKCSGKFLRSSEHVWSRIRMLRTIPRVCYTVSDRQYTDLLRFLLPGVRDRK
jgi:hypothetical protein